ncbi:MAG: AAA family ATPase, partial [Victivallales bacterium]|nr:AAA family ATPase [Victivallales bacterium]
LNIRLQECATEHGIALTQSAPQERLVELMQTLAKTAQVVVLVDEYDKPILSNIASPQVSELLRELKGFYSAIKTYEGLIRFALVTGVSKFAHVSLFSELNNLTDITLHPDYAGMLGFTAAEIREYFADRIPLAAEANGMSPEALTEQLLEWYDGYRFSRAETHVCNPVSVSKFFARNGEFSNYWGNTGTPTFLLELARDTRLDFEAALQETYSESVFSAYELDRLPVVGLLWQTGYLTIRETIATPRLSTRYRLGFPDYEVQESFNEMLLDFYTERREHGNQEFLFQMMDALEADNHHAFLKLFQGFLATVPYNLHLKYEKYYQTIFFCVFELLNGAVEAESCTNAGRIDAVVRTSRTVFLFEFKLNRSAEEAVSQILDRKYYEKYQPLGLPIICIGANFDSSTGQLTGWAETTLAEK